MGAFAICLDTLLALLNICCIVSLLFCEVGRKAVRVTHDRSQIPSFCTQRFRHLREIVRRRFIDCIAPDIARWLSVLNRPLTPLSAESNSTMVFFNSLNLGVNSSPSLQSDWHRRREGIVPFGCTTPGPFPGTSCITFAPAGPTRSAWPQCLPAAVWSC
jgi:hypothetical protein